MSAGDPPVLNVTLWPDRPVQFTLPPCAMSTLNGENVDPDVLTFPVSGNAPVTAMVTKLDALALPIVAAAVMFGLPAATPVTSPVAAFTVAKPVLLELHTTVAPPIGLPNWSRGEAESCSVADTATVVPPVITTEVRTGTAATVIPRPSLTVTAPAVAVAVMVTLPAATADTSPDTETVARAAFDVDHTTLAAIAPPNWSRGAAVSCSVCPAVTVVAGALTATDASTSGAAVTVIARLAERLTPPAVACALITTVPAAVPVTRPLCDTDATFGAVVAQATFAAMGFPDWSSVTAVNCTVWPT